jgi:hypothetical protein
MTKFKLPILSHLEKFAKWENNTYSFTYLALSIALAKFETYLDIQLIEHDLLKITY